MDGQDNEIWKFNTGDHCLVFFQPSEHWSGSFINLYLEAPSVTMTLTLPNKLFSYIHTYVIQTEWTPRSV